MRRLIWATALVLLASPLGLQGGDVRLGSCEASVGAWEFSSEEGGRAVIAREGDKYHALWITTFAAADGRTQPEGVAADCTCRDASDKLVWKCLVTFSFDSSQVGATQTFEWTVDGGTLKSWYIAPDGKRSATGLRRTK